MIVIYKKKIIIFISIIILLVIGLFFVLNLVQKPLRVDGFTEYNNSKKQVDIELINNGRYDIFIQEIKADNKIPNLLQLVISYTGHLVAGGIDNEPLAKFIDVKEAPIHPKLTQKEYQVAIKTNTIPINYGIRIKNEEDIEVVQIKYKYMGFTFIKKINLNSWSE